MSTKYWLGRTAILSIANGGTDSDVLDLGGHASVIASGVCDAGGGVTSVITASIYPPPLVANSLKGKIIRFRPDTPTTAALAAQERLISANNVPSAGVPCTITVAALTDAPAALDTFDIISLGDSKTYREMDIVISGPAAVTGNVNVLTSDQESGGFVVLQSGGADIVLPANKTTPLIPIVGRYLMLVGGAQGQLTHFRLMGQVRQ